VFYVSLGSAVYMAFSTLAGTCIIRRRRLKEERYTDVTREARPNVKYEQLD